MSKVYFLEILITDQQLGSIKALSPFFQRIYKRLRVDIPGDDKVVLLVGVKNTLAKGEDKIVELSQHDLLTLSEHDLRTLLCTPGGTKKNIAFIHVCQTRILDQEIEITEYLKAFQEDEFQKRLSSYAVSEALNRRN